MAQLLLPKDIPYSPAVSSPLNPSSCYNIPTKPHRPRRGHRIIHGTPTTPLSPTQQLLRQKAQVAFNSESLQREFPSVEAGAVKALEKYRVQRSYLGDVKARGLRKPYQPAALSCPAAGDIGMGEVHEIVEEAGPGEKEPLLNDDGAFRVDLGEAEPIPQADEEHKGRKPTVGVRIVRKVVLMVVLFSVFVVVPALRVRSLYKRHFGS